MASLTLITWRDIPSAVVVKRGRETAKAKLSNRFQEAIDRAAMRAGKGSSELYIAEWRRTDPQPCGDDIELAARTEAERLEALFSDDDLERMIRNKGIDE